MRQPLSLLCYNALTGESGEIPSPEVSTYLYASRISILEGWLKMAENGVQKSAYTYQKGDALLIPALASGETVQGAAKIAGVGERTATRRLTDPAFRAEVQHVQREMVDKV